MAVIALDPSAGRQWTGGTASYTLLCDKCTYKFVVVFLYCALCIVLVLHKLRIQCNNIVLHNLHGYFS